MIRSYGGVNGGFAIFRNRGLSEFTLQNLENKHRVIKPES
jgi:hypothetical protein